jgi:integrase
MLSGASIMPRIASAEPSLLPQQPRFPRELRPEEITALVRASDDQTRLAALLLLSGISSEEALRLVWNDVDADGGVIHVADGSGRDVVVGEPLRRCLTDHKGQASEFVLGTAGRASTRDGIDAQLLCSAHDAGIEGATEITSEALRHTYVAYLVRQRIRFADLTRIVGPLPVEVVAAYSSLTPPGTRIDRDAIKLLHPALSEEIT